MAWEFSSGVEPVLKKLKKEKYKIVAIEQSPTSIDYKKVREQIGSHGNIAFLVGNEVDGVPAEILKHCDIVAEIPMKGGKESLNVSTAFGIAVFRILDI